MGAGRLQPEVLRVRRAPDERGTSGVYDRLAPVYDRLQARFLGLAGGEAQAAVEGALATLLVPGMRVLDVGCGTGTLARRLLAMEPLLALTLVDPSPRMLARTSGLAVRRLHAALPRVPLPDGSFDAVLALWSIETLADPLAGVHELIRLTRPGGTVCMAFCAALDGVDWRSLCVGTMLRMRGTGRLLAERKVDAALREGGASVVRWPTCRGPVRAAIATVGVGPRAVPASADRRL